MKRRGADQNPKNRFEKPSRERDEEWSEAEDPAPRTRFGRDRSRSSIVQNDSPDLGGARLNPVRGGEHGCVYCFARPYPDYPGLSAGLDIETKIFLKADAPGLLRKALSSPT